MYVSFRNGLVPHEWEPSAKESKPLIIANMVVERFGSGRRMEDTLDRLTETGVYFFTCSDYIPIRYVGEGAGIPSDAPIKR
jgi:hypothetical protein